MEAVIADTVQPGKFCVTMADHPPKITEDGGQTFRNLPGLDGYSGSTAAVMSGTDSKHYLYGLVRHGRTACIARSRDGGDSAAAVLSLGPGLFVQALREDRATQELFMLMWTVRWPPELESTAPEMGRILGTDVIPSSVASSNFAASEEVD